MWQAIDLYVMCNLYTICVVDFIIRSSFLSYSDFAITKHHSKKAYLCKLPFTVFLSLWNVKYFIHVWFWLLFVKFQQQCTRQPKEKAQILYECQCGLCKNRHTEQICLEILCFIF